MPTSSFNRNQRIWFNYPAEYWNSQALHLGNSLMGASFYGGVRNERLDLTEKSMWTGEPANGDWEKAGVNPNAKKNLPLIRDAVVQGDTERADQLVRDHLLGDFRSFGGFTSMGALHIEFRDHQDSVQDYIRLLDLASATGHVQYSLGNTQFRREYFCSYPDQLLVLRFAKDGPSPLGFRLWTDCLQETESINADSRRYRLRGTIKGNGRPFEVSLEVRLKSGRLVKRDAEIEIEDADQAEILLTAATNYAQRYPDYVGEDPSVLNNRRLDAALGLSYDTLKRRHVEDYRSLYDRVAFELYGDADQAALPTDQRFARMREGTYDPGYVELAANLGRYMIIATSRPGSLPANIQGVWNAFERSPWSGNYQSNINLQEIYWPCGPTDLLECHTAYLDWIEDLAHSGREIAQRVYGTKGWVSHTTGDIWGHAAPIGELPWALYPVGAAWHCQHLWDHYAFNQDREYLEKRAFPLMKEASLFWLENLVPFKGFLISAPTVSAEHGALETEDGLNPAFFDLKSDQYRYNLPGVYQDIQMIRDLFTNTAHAARLLGETEFADELNSRKDELLPYRIGKYGQLQEWYQDIDHPDCHHRHIAHLYAVCPGSEISPLTTPELAEAAKVSLNMRGEGRYLDQELAAGGNWSRAHRMFCWARLLDGDRSYKILCQTLTEQGFENVLTFQHDGYHWDRPNFYMEDEMYLHFQIDASASIPGLLAEMVLQSHLGELHLLPALPAALPMGSITGLRARGAIGVDIRWRHGELEAVNIHLLAGMELPPVRLKRDLIDPRQDPRIKVIPSEA